MKIFTISDIHGETKYIEAAAGLIGGSDLVAICGDIAGGGDRDSALDILSRIERYSTRIIAVHGNWDHDDVRELLERKGYSIHGKGRIIQGIGFFGVGGSGQTPMNTACEYTEEEINDILAAGYRDISGAVRAVLISHAPPHRVRDRTFIGLRGGSRAIRTFLEGTAIELCLVGHIHEAFGVERLNECIVANSGSFKKGRYSMVNIDERITVEQEKF
jgi:uncharacterized protein